MMDLVERPEPPNAMQQVVDAPLHEVSQDQEHGELCQEGPACNRRTLEVDAKRPKSSRGRGRDGTREASREEREDMAVQR
jgi:hypothetical protein